MSGQSLTPTIAEREWLEETLLPDDAARFLKVEKGFLERKRCTGGGPRFRRLSARLIVYVRRDLIAWRDQQAFESTSEYAERLPSSGESAPEEP